MKFIFIIFIMLGLSACGNNNDDQNENKMKEIAIYAQDSIDFVKENNSIIIDISNKVKAENNQKLVISNIKSLSNDQSCDVVDINGLTFNVLTNNLSICRYEYKVKPKSNSFSGEKTGISQIVVTNNPERGEYLIPITKNINSSTKDKVNTLKLDLSKLSLPKGFLLKKTSVNLIGTTTSGNLGNFSVSDNIIKYEAPIDTQGIVRILFTAIDETLTEVRPGVIYIAIGQDKNESPSVDPLTYLDKKSLIDHGREINISKYISDPDGDELQLVGVYSNGLGIISNITEKSFYYTPESEGTQYLVYIISDHNGGYGLGQIIYDVDAFPNIYDESQLLMFSPTFSMSELEREHGSFSDIYIEDGSKGIPGAYPLFSRNLAEAYCSIKGMTLPTKSQLKELYRNKLSNISVFRSQYQWPSGFDYIAADGSLSLDNGFTHYNKKGYLSCILPMALPSETSFNDKYMSVKWGESIPVIASVDSNGKKYNINSYNLYTEVLSTQPEGLESNIDIEVINNNVKVNYLSNIVNSAVIKITDPININGIQSETKLFVGIKECSNKISFIDAQKQGCIPIVRMDNDDIITLPISANVIKNINSKLDIISSKISVTDTIPSYFLVDDAFNLKDNSIKEYCNILNVNNVSGRNNWKITKKLLFKGNKLMIKNVKLGLHSNILDDSMLWFSENLVNNGFFKDNLKKWYFMSCYSSN
ncbi:TPA: hypothetical protein ACX6MH_001474 [Photobacterium damselae]